MFRLFIEKDFEWFTVSEGDKLFVSTLLSTSIAWTMPSVLLVLGRTIFLFREFIQTQANRENYCPEIFKQAENEDNMKCTIQNTNYVISTPPQNKGMYAK